MDISNILQKIEKGLNALNIDFKAGKTKSEFSWCIYIPDYQIYLGIEAKRGSPELNILDSGQRYMIWKKYENLGDFENDLDCLFTCMRKGNHLVDIFSTEIQEDWRNFADAFVLEEYSRG